MGNGDGWLSIVCRSVKRRGGKACLCRLGAIPLDRPGLAEYWCGRCKLGWRVTVDSDGGVFAVPVDRPSGSTDAATVVEYGPRGET